MTAYFAQLSLRAVSSSLTINGDIETRATRTPCASTYCQGILPLFGWLGAGLAALAASFLPLERFDR